MMCEAREVQECLQSNFSLLWKRFVEINEMGIKVRIHMKMNRALDAGLAIQIQEIVLELLEAAVADLKETKAPILYFLLYEEKELCMELAYPKRKSVFWKHGISNIKRMKKHKKYLKQIEGCSYCLVEMEYEGRICNCHAFRFLGVDE